MESPIFWQKFPERVQNKIWIWDCICLRGISMSRVMGIKMNMEIQQRQKMIRKIIMNFITTS